MMREYRARLKLVRCLVLLVGSVGSVPGLVWAQGTAPVTVVPILTRQMPFGAGCIPDSSQCDAANTSTLVIREIVLPSVQPLVEAQTVGDTGSSAIQPVEPGRTPTGGTTNPQGGSSTPGTAPGPSSTYKPPPRVFGGVLRYERLNLDTRRRGLEGDVYSLTLQQLWHINTRFTAGVLFQDDLFHLQRLDAHRVSAVAYGQYTHHFLPSPQCLERQRVLRSGTPYEPCLTLTTTANANYTHTAIAGDTPNVNTFGGGLSLALTLDRGAFVVGSAVSYQVHADDQKQDNDPQHLVKMGLRAGVRLPRPSLAITLAGSWTHDATHYRRLLDPVDTDYFDGGADVVWSLSPPTISPNVRLIGGYRKVFGLNHVTSDMVFLGALLNF